MHSVSSPTKHAKGAHSLDNSKNCLATLPMNSLREEGILRISNLSPMQITVSMTEAPTTKQNFPIPSHQARKALETRWLVLWLHWAQLSVAPHR